MTLVSLSLQGLAQSPGLEFEKSAAQAKRLEQSLDFFHVVLKVAAEIEKEGAYNQEGFLETDKSFEDFYRQHQEKFISYYEREFHVPKSKLTEFREAFNRIRKKEWKRIFSEIWQFGRTYFRKNGPAMALAIAVGNLTNFVLPVALYSFGPQQLLPVALTVPWVTIFMAFPQAWKKLSVRRKMMKELGGKKAYLDYKHVVEAFHQKVGLRSPEHFLYPLEFGENSVRAISLRSSNVWQSILGKLGIATKSISVNSVQNFLIVHGLHLFDKNEVRKIVRHPLPPKLKIVYMVRALYESGDEKLIQKFEQKFHSSFVNIKKAASWGELFEWTNEMQNAKTLTQVRRGLKRIPNQVDAREILNVWEEILLPHYAQEDQFEYSSFRELSNEFQRLKLRLNESSDKSWGSFSADFEKYFFEAVLKRHWRGCSPSLEKIFRFLTVKTFLPHRKWESSKFQISQTSHSGSAPQIYTPNHGSAWG